MRQVGSLAFLLGVAAIVLNYLDRVPKLLVWIYSWGEGPAWGIKIGLIVIGAALWFFGGRKDKAANE